MAEEDCRPQVQACAIRVTRLDSNGVPSPGADNIIVSDALISMGFTAVYTDGDEIEEKNACGGVAVNFRAADSFKRGDVSLSLTTPDPALLEMLTDGSAFLQDGVDLTRPPGYAAPSIGQSSGNGVSIELWANRVSGGDLDQDWPYAWWVYPKVKNLRIGDHTHQNGALLPALVGQAFENTNWFDGPENDWPADSDRVYQWIPTNTLPVTSCGYQTLAAS